MAFDGLRMAAPPEVYQQRRATLAAALGRPMVLLAGWSRSRTYPGNTYPFRPGSHYLYFGGPPIEGAAWLIEPGSNGAGGSSLLRPPSSLDDAVWMGEAISDEVIAAAAGIDSSTLTAPDALSSLLGGRPTTALSPPCLRSREWVRSLGLDSPQPDELLPIIDMRLIKDEHERKALRRAAKVGVEAHLAVMRATGIGTGEAHTAAALLEVLTRHQCEPSFTPIVTTQGEVLHCSGYPNRMEAGRLLLVDAGAEEPGGYASDITRTYPVDGRFTPVQRQLYDTVLRAQQAAVGACLPGKRYRDVHDLAARVICEGLVEAGLLSGDPADLVSRGAHALFFAHGLGHLIGLDVHDMEDFGDLAGYAPGRTRRTQFGSKFLRLDRDLLPGMAVTIEPGIYLIPAIWRSESLWGRFKDVVNRSAVDGLLDASFGGIRIEDTIVIGEGRDAEPENLTEELPKDGDAVCAIVRGDP